MGMTYNSQDLSASGYNLKYDGHPLPAPITANGSQRNAAAGGRAVFVAAGRKPSLLKVPCIVTSTSASGVLTALNNIKSKLDVAEEKALRFDWMPANTYYYAIPLDDATDYQALGYTAKFTLNFYLASPMRFGALAGAQNTHNSGQSRTYTMEGNDYTPRAVITIAATGGDTGTITIANSTTGETVAITNGLANGETLVYNTWYQSVLVGSTSRVADLVGGIWALKAGANVITITTANAVQVTATVQAEGAYNP